MVVTDERKEVNGKLIGRVVFAEKAVGEYEFLNDYVSVEFKDEPSTLSAGEVKCNFLYWVDDIKDEQAKPQSFFFTKISNIVIEAGGLKRNILLEEVKDEVLSLIG